MSPQKITVSGYGKAVKYYRQQAELTQEEFAVECGIRPNTVSELERGFIQKPQVNTLKAIVMGLQAMGLDIDQDKFDEKVAHYETLDAASQPSKKEEGMNSVPDQKLERLVNMRMKLLELEDSYEKQMSILDNMKIDESNHLDGREMIFEMIATHRKIRELYESNRPFFRSCDVKALDEKISDLAKDSNSGLEAIIDLTQEIFILVDKSIYDLSQQAKPIWSNIDL